MASIRNGILFNGSLSSTDRWTIIKVGEGWHNGRCAELAFTSSGGGVFGAVSKDGVSVNRVVGIVGRRPLILSPSDFQAVREIERAQKSVAKSAATYVARHAMWVGFTGLDYYPPGKSEGTFYPSKRRDPKARRAAEDIPAERLVPTGAAGPLVGEYKRGGEVTGIEYAAGGIAAEVRRFEVRLRKNGRDVWIYWHEFPFLHQLEAVLQRFGEEGERENTKVK